MSRLFFECTALESVNLSSFDTSNVKRMSYMFYGCHKLTSLPVGGFNTSSVRALSETQ